ncbi:MAG: transposase [Deltaproteobacteria bacterium]|nr:transposase [Deltaproteobacteria bacterium]
MFGSKSLNPNELLKIRVFFNKSKEPYGSPRIYKEMEGTVFNIGLNRVAKIMIKAGLKDSRVYKKQYKQSIKENEAAPNIIN